MTRFYLCAWTDESEAQAYLDDARVPDDILSLMLHRNGVFTNLHACIDECIEDQVSVSALEGEDEATVTRLTAELTEHLCCYFEKELPPTNPQPGLVLPTRYFEANYVSGDDELGQYFSNIYLRIWEFEL